MDINYQALFTAYMVLLIIFGFIAFSCLLVLFFTIPLLLHPYFYADGAMLLTTGLVQVTCGFLLIIIDRNRCCCGKEFIQNNLKTLLFPVSLVLFAAMWVALLAMPHNNISQLREGLQDEVRRNDSDGLLKLAHLSMNCCGIEDEMTCSKDYLPLEVSGIAGYLCPKGSPYCQRGCLLSIWQSMILPYRPIEMALGLFGLLLLAVCPLTYAISRCRLYWCPNALRQDSGQSTPYLVSADDMAMTDDIVPLYPRPTAEFNPVLNSLLPRSVTNPGEQPTDGQQPQQNGHQLVK